MTYLSSPLDLLHEVYQVKEVQQRKIDIICFNVGAMIGVGGGQKFTKIFLTQGTVTTAFGQSNLNGCVNEVPHFYNQCSSKSRNGASQNQ